MPDLLKDTGQHLIKMQAEHSGQTAASFIDKTLWESLLAMRAAQEAAQTALSNRHYLLGVTDSTGNVGFAMQKLQIDIQVMIGRLGKQIKDCDERLFHHEMGNRPA